MQLGIEPQIPDGLLAANALLAENSRQGVPTSTHTLHRGFEFAISSTYKGFQFRCSESASDPVDAPNNGPRPGCVQGALLSNAVSVGIDAVGLIPEAGGVARFIGNQAGYRGVVADQLGAKIIGAFGKSTSTVNGLASITDTSALGLASTALTIVGFIPGAGQIASGASLTLDLYKTYKAVSACYSHP